MRPARGPQEKSPECSNIKTSLRQIQVAAAWTMSSYRPSAFRSCDTGVGATPNLESASRNRTDVSLMRGGDANIALSGGIPSSSKTSTVWFTSRARHSRAGYPRAEARRTCQRDPPPPRTPRESGRRPRGRAYSRRLIGRCSWCLLADPRWDFTTYSHKGKGRLAEARPYGWVLGAKELLLMLDQ